MEAVVTMKATPGQFDAIREALQTAADAEFARSQDTEREVKDRAASKRKSREFMRVLVEIR